MMMERWHTAYQEALHLPVIVRFPPAPPATGADTTIADFVPPRQIDALTSHIDILPTILGLAGVDAAQRELIRARPAVDRDAPPLPGVDLSSLLKGETDQVIESDGRERQGVLFITGDEITAPLPPLPDPNSQKSEKEFAIYNLVVEAVRTGANGKPPVDLAPGSVRQPNNVRSVRTLAHKLSRYFDPSHQAPHEWEMYDLVADPNETTNLVQVATARPTARTDLPPPYDPAAIQADADRLAVLLDELEARDL